ncbi:transglutaminase-like domain-containing protein [Streptomyces sp. V4-01]|uniref:Transglutaminase-like domain-containing protein n=1 Tax=Actinacidiphila polyblastidii TaxID=3110430 RepID=A0ABU7PNC3_9ACTN|nr:transglutaminase-like domain-containing protein [Streptomyces sp. V4-01]
MTAGHNAQGIVLAAAVTVLAATVLGTARGRPAAGRWRVAAAALAAASVAACAAIVPLPPLGRHHDVVTARQDVRPEVDPLSRLPRWSALGRTPVLHASFASPPGASALLWPVLAYDAYAPATGWRTSPRLIPLPPSGSGGSRVEVRLEEAERLVPHPFSVHAASPAGTRADGATEALRLARAGASYTVTFSVHGSAAGPPAPAPAAIACTEPELRSLAGRVDRSASLGEQLAALERFLAATTVVTPYGRAAPDDSCAAVAAVLRTGRGSGDQIATAFALAARMLGASSRVAVGFAPRRAVGPKGRLDIVGGDAAAWPQIASAGGTWLDYWPQPARAADGGTAGRTGTAAEGGSTAADPVRPAADGHARSWLLPGLCAAAASAVLAAGATAAAVRRGRARRHRQRRPEAASTAGQSPRARVLTSWQEALRASVECAGPATTARDVAEGSPPPALGELAALVDRVLYVPPARAGEADAARAEELAAAAAVRSHREASDERRRARRFSRRPSR